MGTTALTAPGFAASFSVGGGTITTTQADASSDSTGTGGPFALQANSTTTGDLVTVTGVSITNTSNTPNGRAFDIGGLLPSSGAYSVVMHGSSLSGGNAAGVWLQSDSGLLSFDSTGGAANIISGPQGLVVASNVNNGSVSIKTGADTITSSGNGEAIYAVSQGTGTISIDSVGATITGGGIYDVVAVGGSGAITIGGLNGGIASTLNASNGAGILTISSGSQSITLAASGIINAQDGISVMGNGVTIDSFGTINATHDAITAPNGTGSFLTVTLESGSVTKGRVLGGITNDTFNIVAGADIANATFNGGGGANTLNLTGSGNAAFALGTASNINSFQMLGSGIWTLTGTQAGNGGWTVASGTLRLGVDNALAASGSLNVLGTFDLNGHNQTIGNLTGNSGGAIALNSGALTINQTTGNSYFGSLNGAGAIVFNGPAALSLVGPNGTTAAITVNGGSLLIRSIGGGNNLTINGGTFVVNNRTIGLGQLSGAGGTLDMSGSFLTFTSNANSSYSGAIVDQGGTGTFIKAGSGTLILTGAGSTAGAPQILGGTLQFGNGGTTGGFFGGSIIDNGTFIFNRSDNISYNGSITGTGTFIKSGSNALILRGNVTVAGGVLINSGSLEVLTNSANGLSGNITNSGALIIAPGMDMTYSDVISGPGSVTVGDGTLAMLTLVNTNTYTGGTTINSGTLKLGVGGTLANSGDLTINGGTFDLNGHAQTVGSLSGTGGVIMLGTGNLTTTSSANAVLASAISGAGSFVKAGTGILTLSGANTYTGTTTVSAGTLKVNGSIANSSVSVVSGAVLNGTGTVGTTTVQSGATLAPGNSIGTLTVNGNLTLASGAIYDVEVSPTAADRTNVSGVASLNGTVATSIASGTYTFGQRFTLVSAAGGVSGTFASLTGIPVSLKGELSYDTNNAYLTLSPNSLAPLLTSPTGNQQNVVSAIDAAVAAGNVPPAGFAALYSLSGPALNSALNQISGQAAPNVTNAVGNSFLSFMSMTTGGGSGETGTFAPGSAYGSADAPHRAQLGTGEMRVWGAVYGGHVGLSGDSVSGAASLSSNNVGMIGGADMKVADGLLAGVTLGLGRQTFRSGNGSGDSDDLMFGLYGRADAGAAYLAASFGIGWHRIETLRVITVSGTDALQGKQNAHDFGGRIETGWHLPLDDIYTVTPYGAFAGSSFESPAYTETALSGASTFALSYATQTTTLGRSELGAHLDRNYALEQGRLTAGIRAAWAHQLDDLPFTQASFIGLPGAAFQVAGVRPAPDTALLGLDLEVQNSSGLFFGLHGEGQFGAGTTAVEGLGNFGWRW